MSRHEVQAYLEHLAYCMRVDILTMTTQAGSGHPTSALSAADLVAALFFYGMGYDPKRYYFAENDRFILSKGHASPVLYAAWKQVGVLEQEQLLTYRSLGSPLEGHPTRSFEKAEAATGSLGMGLSIGAGMALYAQRQQRSYNTYVLMGDAEISEGSIWEAAEIAAHYTLDNLIGIVDCNRLGQSTESLHGHHVHRYAQKFEAFGWHVLEIDGHDMQQIMDAYDKANAYQDGPIAIVAKTIKGYGVTSAENQLGFHGKAFPKEQLSTIQHELEKRFHEAATYTGTPEHMLGRYGTFLDKHSSATTLPEQDNEHTQTGCIGLVSEDPLFKQGELLATRKAYGHALTDAGRACERIYCLDAEVSNSTYAQTFQERFPERFVECYVAEQNMVSMGVGLEQRGAVPFISTFGAFFTRAHDQIRMAAIGQAALRLVGSHAGVSIGQDGPSQMALEDISMMRCLPDSTVLYPSDAVSTYRLVQQMVEYNQGISYLRTTRADTATLYEWHEQFPIGSCKVIRAPENPTACIIAAGITLHEALKAYDQLAEQDIAITVIDLYCIKPLPHAIIAQEARKAASRVITVEDHYLQGGIGETVAAALNDTDIQVTPLAVTQLPHSGLPDQLLAWAGINAEAIIHAVQNII